MANIVQIKGPAARTSTVPRVLYIGPAADEICNLVVKHIGRVDVSYESEVQAAFAHMRRRVFDVVIVDQRDENLATRLILPVLTSIGYPVKPVVISPLKDISHYLAIPGVARVLTAPVKEVQFLRILGLERRQNPVEAETAPTDTEVPPKPVAAKAPGLVQMLSDRFMGVVSMLYKRAAFVLLFSLFIAFGFYAVLIGFFLMSSGWGAPLTLGQGHEIVNRVERDITEVKVALNQTEQRLSDAALAKVTADQELSDATDIVAYAAGTVKKEMQARGRQRKVLEQSVKRLSKVRDQLAAQVEKGGPSADLAKLYSRRLIDKKSYSSSTLNLIDAGQKLAAVEIQIDEANEQIATFDTSQTMLKSLLEALQKGGGLNGISASGSDLLLLTKQSSDALSLQAVTKSKLQSLVGDVVVLTRSKEVLENQLKTLEGSALARAMTRRIDVVFVPYGNEKNFAEGAPVFTCAFTIIPCHQAGHVGKALPGEVNSVHPFFGKPIRGSFVELKLDDPTAAMREIIHGTRKPLLF